MEMSSRKNLPEVGTKVYGLFAVYGRGSFAEECVFEEKCKAYWGIYYFNTKIEAYHKLQILYERQRNFA